jgi:hypothetical protein
MQVFVTPSYPMLFNYPTDGPGPDNVGWKEAQNMKKISEKSYWRRFREYIKGESTADLPQTTDEMSARYPRPA